MDGQRHCCCAAVVADVKRRRGGRRSRNPLKVLDLDLTSRVRTARKWRSTPGRSTPSRALLW
eukprot:603966-Prymnesium_polylepis.3